VPGGDQEGHCGLHLHTLDEAGDDEVEGLGCDVVWLVGCGRCGCLCGLGQAGDYSGHGAVVGGQSGGEGQEAFGVQPGRVFQVDAVDGEEVRVDVVAVLADPGNID
jgi:hypothetical protein